MDAHHLPVFIRDLAIILMTAGLTSLVCRWLKQSVILGYVVAGLLVGPYTDFTATVSDTKSVNVWGEIGVIFVLFGLGLEFSFRKLAKVGGSAGITAGVQTVLMLIWGALLGFALGWSRMDAIFLGGMLCISSTIIIVKVFEDLGLKGRGFTHLVFGVLIVEDIVAILLLVLLSTMAVTRELSGGELMMATLRLGFFLTLWFVVGLFVLPGLMRMLRKYFNAETMLIFSVGLCLMMVLIATQAGFSPALGAFVMGSLLAETDEGPNIEHVLHPLRNFFGAVFFVSVGMLFDPKALLNLWPQILAVTALVIVGKMVSVSGGALLAGQNLKTAIRAGASMGQIGEFSFIIASLGLSLNVIDKQLYPIAIGVALLTSCLTPMLLKRADPLHRWIEHLLPRRVHRAIERYHATLQSHRGNRITPALLRAYAPLILINGVMILAMTGIARAIVFPQLEAILGPGPGTRLIGLMIDLVLCVPFFWGMCLRRPSKNWRARAREYPRMRYVEVLLGFFRICLGLFLFLVIVAQYLSWRTLSGVTLSLLLLAGFVFYAYGGRMYRKLEARFLGELMKGEDSEEIVQPLLPWDTHLTELTVSPNSTACGLTIEKLGLNESFGVMVAAITRGKRRILAPRANEQVFPHDRLAVIGNDMDIERLKTLIEVGHHEDGNETPLRLQSLMLEEHSPLKGKTVRESQIRQKVQGLLVGVERQGYKQLNPPADLRLEAGDRLWIVGDPSGIAALNSP